MNLKEALKHFALKRTGDINTTFKGVEMPSQMRFVKYFDTLINRFGGIFPTERQLDIKSIILNFMTLC